MAAQKKIVPLAKLNAEMHRPTIMGRIVKLWIAYNPSDGTKFSYDFILVDKEGTAIEGFIDVNDPDLDDILQQIEEGCIYEIYKYRPCNKRSTFRTVEHDLRIQLTGATVITKIQHDNRTIPRHYFDFKPLSSIGVTIKEVKTIIDIIGQVVWIGPIRQIKQNSGPVSIRDIEIEDERDARVLVTIWEDFLSQINVQKMQEESKKHPFVLAFSSLQLVCFSKKWSLKTYSGTRIFQDQSFPYIADFRKKIVQKKVQLIIDETELPEGQPDNSFPVPVSIEELHQMCTADDPDKQFKCVAEITEVLDEYGWYYNACPTHKTWTEYVKPYYICSQCSSRIEKPEPWYNFSVTVSDGTAQAEFVFIGRQAELLLGSPAHELIMQQKNEKRQYLPSKFHELIHRKLSFTVKWNKNRFRGSCITFQVTKTAPVQSDLLQVAHQDSVSSTVNTLSPEVPTTPVEIYKTCMSGGASTDNKISFSYEPHLRPAIASQTKDARK